MIDPTPARDHRLVGRQVQRAQRRLVARGVAGVHAVHGAAVAQVVLGVGEHGERSAALLKPVGVGDAHGGRKLGRLAERLVGAAPALVAGDRHHGREGEVGARAGGLFGDGGRDLLDQGRIARGAETDVVRKDDGALHGPDPVNDVQAIDDRDLEAARERGLPEPVDHVGPAGGGVGGGGRAPLAVDGADAVRGDVRRGDVGALDLLQLRQLLVGGHHGRGARWPCRGKPASGRCARCRRPACRARRPRCRCRRRAGSRCRPCRRCRWRRSRPIRGLRCRRSRIAGRRRTSRRRGPTLTEEPSEDATSVECSPARDPPGALVSCRA